MLTSKEIRMLLQLLAQEVTIAPSPEFPYTVTRLHQGYSSDKVIGSLQAKLSIMLEAKAKYGR